MTFQSGTGFTQIETDSGTATITNTKPNASVVGTNGIATSASGNTVTIDGSSVVGLGSLIFIESKVASNQPTLEFTGFPLKNRYFITFNGVRNASLTDLLQMQISNDGGSTWITTGYQSQITYFTIGGSSMSSESSEKGCILGGFNNPSSSNDTLNGQGYISSIGAQQSFINGTSTWRSSSSGGVRNGLFAGATGGTGLNAIRFINFDNIQNPGTNILEGRFTLYYVKDS